MFKIDADLIYIIIYIIFMAIICYAWSYIVIGELFDEFLRYAEKKNKERENNANSN